jgi:hypothetical protein
MEAGLNLDCYIAFQKSMMESTKESFHKGWSLYYRQAKNGEKLVWLLGDDFIFSLLVEFWEQMPYYSALNRNRQVRMLGEDRLAGGKTGSKRWWKEETTRKLENEGFGGSLRLRWEGGHSV